MRGHASAGKGSINRNIVECKDFSTVNLERSPWVLIETLWNVKTERLSNKTICLRINRNIVECKAVISKLDGINNGRINRNIVECKAMIVYGILWDIEY